MKPACGIKTIKGVVAWGSLMGTGYTVFQLLQAAKKYNDACKDGESECTKLMLLIAGAILGAWLFLTIAYVVIRLALV